MLETVLSIPFCRAGRHTIAMEASWRERAKARMKEVGMTQNALSEILSMTQGGLQHWLAGTRQPSIDDINRIADELRMPRTALTHGVDESYTIDGLRAKAIDTLRRLIAAERATPLPDDFWAAIDSMTKSVAPKAPQQDEKSDEPPRNGTHG